MQVNEVGVLSHGRYSEGGFAPLRSPSARALRGLASRKPLRVPNLPPAGCAGKAGARNAGEQ